MLIGTLAAVSYADYGYYADRLSREHRIASDVDEWIERGNATITASPIFEDGMRLTAWASTHVDTDKYEFAIASGVYLFEIPHNAQSIEILVRYKGEPNKFEINDDYEPIAGRVWIRNLKRETTRRGYHDQSASETRYGDTFVLRAKNRSETIKIPTAGHVDKGWMELHIVAEGGEQLDVEYIEVSTYRRAPKVRVIQHYTPRYHWRPWHRYTYLYFYDGPIFYSSGYDSYLCWSYPVYDHHFLTIRSYYGGYLGRYRTHYPARYSYYHSPYYYGGYGRATPVYRKRTQLNRWSAKHDTVRKQYSRSRLATPSRSTQRTQIQNDVRVVIENHRREAPTPTERVSRSTIISQKQRASVARLTPQQNGTVRSYSSRTRSSVQTTDRQRRLVLNSRSTVNTSRNRTSAVSQRSSLLQKRSVVSSSRTSTPSSSSTRSSLIDRTKQRNTSAISSRTTQTKTEPKRVSRTSSSSSQSRSSTSSRTSTSSSSSSDDDDDDKTTRSRTSERSKRRR